MGQPGALVIAGIDDDLGLAGQPAECGRVHDPVPITFEAGALAVGFLRDCTMSGTLGEGSAWSGVLRRSRCSRSSRRTMGPRRAGRSEPA